MSDAVPPTDVPTRPLTLFGIAVTGVLASACLGAITNAVNGRVSARYFVTILGWRDVEDMWRESIAQGIFEGSIWGVEFGGLVSVVLGLIVLRGSWRRSQGSPTQASAPNRPSA
jgi:hypothetical protein